MSGGESRNQKLLAGLTKAQAEGRLHHAYLLAGPESPAKLDCAQKLAAQFSGGLFADPAAALARIKRGHHPDFLRIGPTEGLISVDEIRALPKALAFPPLEAGRRVVVIESAQEMNAQAANALLKILEEPPGHTMFFLFCREPSELLPTVVSRCQILRFAPLADDELLASLADEGLVVDDPTTVTAWSEGSVARAALLTGTEGGAILRREACECLLSLWEASPRIPSHAFRWVEGVTSEEGVEITLGSWEILARDLAFAAAGASMAGLRFPEFHPRLNALSVARSAAVIDEVSRKTAAINRFRVYKQFNGNLRLDFAALLSELQMISVGKATGAE